MPHLLRLLAIALVLSTAPACLTDNDLDDDGFVDCPGGPDTVQGAVETCSADATTYPASGTMRLTHDGVEYGEFAVGVNLDLDGQVFRTTSCSLAPEEAACWNHSDFCRCWNVETAWNIGGVVDEGMAMDWETFSGVGTGIGAATLFRDHLIDPKAAAGPRAVA